MDRGLQSRCRTTMFLTFALLSLFFVLSAVIPWMTYGRRRSRFLPHLETVLECPEFVAGFGGRSSIKGEFSGRNVAIRVHDTEDQLTLIVSMETRAARTMDTYDFADYKGDRDGEAALFALQVKHELVLRHVDGWLKAQWYPVGLFARSFDRSKWRSVLVAMNALAGSIERRAPPLTVSAAG